MLLYEIFTDGRVRMDELRRNPQVNTRVKTLDALQKYAGRKDVFVSFTHDVGILSHVPGKAPNVGKHEDSASRFKSGVNARGAHHNVRGSKLGINPLSSYDTPLGIYAYPVDYVLSKTGAVEFGELRPYMYVFAARQPDKLLDLDAYAEADLKRDVAVLRKKIRGLGKRLAYSKGGEGGGAGDARRQALEHHADDGGDVCGKHEFRH